MVDELIKANKDFDLLMLPNRGHGFGSEAYMVRRRWDYFVRHLLGAEPPKEYSFTRRPRPDGVLPEILGSPLPWESAAERASHSSELGLGGHLHRNRVGERLVVVVEEREARRQEGLSRVARHGVPDLQRDGGRTAVAFHPI